MSFACQDLFGRRTKSHFFHLLSCFNLVCMCVYRGCSVCGVISHVGPRVRNAKNMRRATTAGRKVGFERSKILWTVALSGGEVKSRRERNSKGEVVIYTWKMPA